MCKQVSTERSEYWTTSLLNRKKKLGPVKHNNDTRKIYLKRVGQRWWKFINRPFGPRTA